MIKFIIKYRCAQQAVLKALEMMNDGHSRIVEIDIAKFFDTVDHDKLMTIFGRTIKDGDVISVVTTFRTQMKKYTCRSWGVSNGYKVGKLNRLIRGWINYFKIGCMKGLCERLDSQIRYRLRMCIWKHWKMPKNKEKNLVKPGVSGWAAHKVANTGNRIAHMCHNGWVQKAISNKRLA